MIIDIEDELFFKIKELMKNRSKTIYEQLENITPIAALPKDTLQKSRETKTKRIKQSIQETIKSLLDEDMKPTKYQIHKRTGVAYVTINKYYDEIS